MRYRLPQGGVIEFAEAAVRTLTAYRQTGMFSLEAGGMLLGRQISGGNDVVIDAASEPSRMDRRARFWFRRARKPAQELVDAAWQQSQGTVNYFGEWHTHPEAVPTPSCVDRRDWRKIARQVNVESSHLYFAIVGFDVTRVWQIDRASRNLHLLVRLDGP